MKTRSPVDPAAAVRATCRHRVQIACVVAGLAVAGSVCRVAHAQAPGGATDAVAAEALFDEGRKLVSAGKYAEACPKFADSQRLNPSPGTLLNLASCWEKLGRSATAWATYRAAASAANAAGRKDYIATAQKHAEALAPKLAHVTLNVPQGIEGLVVRRDGVSISTAEWGLAIPVDVGAHPVEASAPGYKGWASSINVPDEGASVVVTVPQLEQLPREPAHPPSASSVPLQPTPAPPSPPPSSGGSEARTGSGQRTAGLVVASAGIVGLGVGAALALAAKSTYNDSLSKCEPNNPGLCTTDGVNERGNARTAGDVASVAFIVGGAALAAGAVVWILAPRAAAPSAGTSLFVAPSLGGAVIRGAW